MPVRTSKLVTFPLLIASSNSKVAAKTSSLPSPCLNESGDMNRTMHASNIIIIIDAAENSVNKQFLSMYFRLSIAIFNWLKCILRFLTQKLYLPQADRNPALFLKHFAKLILINLSRYHSKKLSVSQKVSSGPIQFIIIMTDLIISFQ